MSELRQSKQTQSLWKDLISQFSGGTSLAASRSVGVVGPAVPLPHPPAHCLRACLHGDPGRIETHGCAWLRAAAAGRLDPACLENGRCQCGLHVSGQALWLNGGTGSLLAVEEAPDGLAEDQTAEEQHDQLLEKLESLSHVFEQIGQLVDENEGLAEEVLRGYEQLNLIFDFTQQIATLTDVAAIEKTLLIRLGKLLAATTMLVVRPDGDCRCYDASHGKWVSQGSASALSDQLTGEIEALRRSRTVSLRSSPDACVVLGPLVRLDDKIDVVLAIRPPNADEFTSGDMLMMESILAFGGQIISNAESHEQLRRTSLESTRSLVAAIDKKDHYTSGHSERVGILARLTGEHLGVPASELQVLEMSGLLHDVGKIGVPEEILCKPGRLTDGEFGIIQKHPVMGYEILKPIASFGAVLDGVLYHHENTDGSGYPEGLSGEEIPLFARIIHVVDVFDALTSTRSYRAAFSFEEACQIVREEADTKLDPEVVRVFLELLPAYRAENPEASAAMFSSEKEVTTTGPEA